LGFEAYTMTNVILTSRLNQAMLDLKSLEMVTFLTITYKNIITEDFLRRCKERVYSNSCQHNAKIPPEYLLITT
jgi:hypothetical protein